MDSEITAPTWLGPMLQETDHPPPTLRMAERIVDKATLPVQPMPRAALAATTPDGRWTALMRRWREGEARWCRLCPRGSCVAVEDSCLLVVPGPVADREALLYSTVGMDRLVRHD